MILDDPNLSPSSSFRNILNKEIMMRSTDYATVTVANNDGFVVHYYTGNEDVNKTFVAKNLSQVKKILEEAFADISENKSSVDPVDIHPF